MNAINNKKQTKVSKWFNEGKQEISCQLTLSLTKSEIFYILPSKTILCKIKQYHDCGKSIKETSQHFIQTWFKENFCFIPIKDGIFLVCFAVELLMTSP